MTAILGLFSGPYAWLVRLGIYGTLALSCAAFGALKMHEHDATRYEKLQSAYADFKAETAAAGKVAQLRADQQKAADLAAKEKADETHKTDLAGLAADNERLRRAAARGNTVPAASPDSRKPDVACFNRALLGDAVDDFVGEVSGQVKSGAGATLDLNNAKTWAQRLKGAGP